MIIQARKKKGKTARGCIKEGGEERAPRRNRKRPLRWEETTSGRVSLRVKSCRGMAESGTRLLEGGRRWIRGDAASKSDAGEERRFASSKPAEPDSALKL